MQTLIKGRICKGYNDIGDFYYAHGDIGSAINMYMKCRVYCTTLTETIKMRLNAILVCIELGQLRCLGTHLNRAGVDIKSHDPSVLAAVDPSLFVKLRCALALNYLYKKEYKLAAEKVCLHTFNFILIFVLCCSLLYNHIWLLFVSVHRDKHQSR